MTDPPPTLDYQTPPPKEPDVIPSTVIAIAGFSASLILCLWMVTLGHNAAFCFAVAIGVPVVGATYLIVEQPRQRRGGTGLIICVGIWALIAFPLCGPGTR